MGEEADVDGAQAAAHTDYPAYLLGLYFPLLVTSANVFFQQPSHALTNLLTQLVNNYSC